MDRGWLCPLVWQPYGTVAPWRFVTTTFTDPRAGLLQPVALVLPLVDVELRPTPVGMRVRVLAYDKVLAATCGAVPHAVAPSEAAACGDAYTEMLSRAANAAPATRGAT